MRRYRGVVVAALAGSLLAIGAPAVGAQSAMGVKGGANFASLTGAVESETMTGLSAGAWLGFALADRLAVQFEGIYAVRGGAGVGIGANALDDAAAPSDVRLSYIEIPVLLRAGYPIASFLPSLFIGPYAGFLLSCRLTLDDGSEGDCEDEARPAWFNPRSTEYGLMMGGGLDFALGESTVFVDARYALGLLSVERGDDAMDLRNTGFTLSGGFAIPLSR